MQKRKSTQFSQLFLGELKKSFSFGLVIVILALFFFSSILWVYSVKRINDNFNIDLDEEYYFEHNEEDDHENDTSFDNMDNFVFENYHQAFDFLIYKSRATNDTYIFEDLGLIDQTIKLAEEELKTLKATQKQQKRKFFLVYYSDPYLSIKNNINTLRYIKANLIGQEFSFPNDQINNPKSANGIFEMLMMMSMQLILIYGVIVASNSYAKELRSGSIKMLMVRPITRNQLTTAKLLSALTHISLMYFFTTACMAIFSVSLYPISKVLTLYSFNAGAFSLVGANVGMLYLWLINYVICISWVTIAYALATIFKNAVIGILSYFILPVFTLPLHYIGLDIVYLSNALNWDAFFSGSANFGPSAIGSNFFITLTMWVVYVVGLTFATYYIINKRDLA